MSSPRVTSPDRLDESEPAVREAAHTIPLGAAPAVGDEVRARDGTFGEVAAVLSTEAAIPRFMVVATGRLRRRYPVLACGLITRIDAGVIQVRGQRRDLRNLPEALPIVV